MNSKFFSKFLFSIALIFSLILSGCSAATITVAGHPQIIQLGTMETIRGIQGVVNGARGSFAMIDATGEVILMAWPRSGQYAYTLMSKSGNPLSANAIRVATEQLAVGAKSLEQGGWSFISRSQIPATLTAAVAAYTTELILLGAQTLPTIFIVPLRLIDPDTTTWSPAPFILGSAA